MRVPVGIVDDDGVRCRQVDSKTPGPVDMSEVMVSMVEMVIVGYGL